MGKPRLYFTFGMTQSSYQSMHVCSDEGDMLVEFATKDPVRDFFDFRDWERRNHGIGNVDLDKSYFDFIMFLPDEIYDAKYINFDTGEFYRGDEVPAFHDPLIGFLVKEGIETLADLKEYCRPSGSNKFF